MARKLEVGVGDIVVDKIREEVTGDGERIIKVTKKRLVKKKKPRRKKGEPIPQEEETPFDFVRVNKVNIFDF